MNRKLRQIQAAGIEIEEIARAVGCTVAHVYASIRDERTGPMALEVQREIKRRLAMGEPSWHPAQGTQ
jgi:predicted transcriptional regulator